MDPPEPRAGWGSVCTSRGSSWNPCRGACGSGRSPVGDRPSASAFHSSAAAIFHRPRSPASPDRGDLLSFATATYGQLEHMDLGVEAPSVVGCLPPTNWHAGRMGHGPGASYREVNVLLMVSGRRDEHGGHRDRKAPQGCSTLPWRTAGGGLAV